MKPAAPAPAPVDPAAEQENYQSAGYKPPYGNEVQPPSPSPLPVAGSPSPRPAPQPELGLPSAQPANPAPAPAPTAQSILGPEYNDDARRRLYETIAERGKKGLIGSAFAGFGDVITNAYGKGGQKTMDETMERSSETEKGLKGEFEAGRAGKVQDFKVGQELKKTGREDQEYKDQNDPNSQMSKLSVGFAAKMLGSDKIKQLGWEPGRTAYADVAKVLPIIEKYVVAEAARADRSLKVSEKESQFKDRQTAAFRNSIQSSDPYKTWTTLQNVRTAADQAMKNPTPYGDVQLIYAAVKAFDPNSVVREGEIKLFQGASSIKTGLQAALSHAFSGKTLTPDQRQNILGILDNYDKTASAVLKQHIEPTRQQATRMGMRMEEIDPLLGKLEQPEPAAGPAGAKPFADQDKEARYQAWKKSQGR